MKTVIFKTRQWVVRQELVASVEITEEEAEIFLKQNAIENVTPRELIDHIIADDLDKIDYDGVVALEDLLVDHFYVLADERTRTVVDEDFLDSEYEFIVQEEERKMEEKVDVEN